MTSISDRIREVIKDPRQINTMARTAPDPRRRVYPPITLELIEQAEARMGLRLPGLLRELYMQVGNGGFGPGYGLFGIAGAPHTSGWTHYNEPADLSAMYLEFTAHNYWPRQLVPICDWGCWYISSIDCSQPAAPVVFFIGAGADFRFHSSSFESWMDDWLNGADLWNQGLDAPPWDGETGKLLTD